MDKYEELAAEIIDVVSDIALLQHPEIKLHTKETKEAGIESPAVICCDEYYRLEQQIARMIKNFIRRKKI